MNHATEIKERGIIFSAEMVRTLLDGHKTQTRRVMKPQPVLDDIDNSDPLEWQNEWHAKLGHCIPSEADEWGFYRSIAQRHDPQCCGCELLGVLPQRYWRCPYGKPGDRLWVRETWGEVTWRTIYGQPGPPTHEVVYKAGPQPFDKDIPHGWTEGKDRWRSPIYMSRQASRITLEVTDVRVERVQAICAYDAFLEGIQLPELAGCKMPTRPPEYENWSESKRDDYVESQARAIYMSQLADCQDHVDAFHTLWDSINAKRGYSWKSNPWVWAITFKRITP